MTRTRRPSPQTLSVLWALDERGSAWAHGYELCRQLDLKAGTVYPILIRLAERGLVETAWESEPPRGRPPRHLYRLSPDGAQVAIKAHHDSARTPTAQSPTTQSPTTQSPTTGVISPAQPGLGLAPG